MAELISMEEWQKAKFLDWSGRYIDAMLSQMTLRQRMRLLREVQKFVDEHNSSTGIPEKT